MLETKRIIGIGNVKEIQVKAYLDYCLKFLGEDDTKVLQEKVTSYAKNMARRFVSLNEDYFSKSENQLEIYKYINSLNADKRHSGYRFWEEVYLRLKAEQVYSGNKHGEEAYSKLKSENSLDGKDKYAQLQLEEDDKYCNL